jgi:hypothetical protein
VSFSVEAIQQEQTPLFLDSDDESKEPLDNKEPPWFPRPKYNVSGLGSYNSRTDLDSHADTTVLGMHCLVVYKTNRTADVSPFLPELGKAEKVPIIQGAIAYDNPDGETIILIVNQALYIPALRDNLLCDNQCRMNDVVVDSCPKSLSENPNNNTHTIRFRNHDDFTIAMQLRGTISYFPTRKPTTREYNDCRHMELTADNPEWDPHSRLFDANENAMTDDEGFIKTPSGRRHIMKMATDIGSELNAQEASEAISAVPRALSDISNTLNDRLFVSSIRSTVEVTYDDFVKSKITPKPSASKVAGTKSKPRYRLTPEILSQKWNIGLEAAKRTLNVTTQRGIKTVPDPSISRRWGTNDRSMRYNRLKSDLFTDYMFANTTSTRGNSGGQVYINSTDWIKIYPTASKGDCHQTFDLLAHREGVPDVLISDQAKEETMGQMRKKVREAGVHYKECEAYSPFQNRAEAGIRELKRAVKRSMVKKATPMRLWDYCAELQADIRSNTALELYALGGLTPETLMKGNTPDISKLVEHEWYDWVKFRDTVPSFPDTNEVLGRWLGPSADIGSEMCYHVLKSTGKVVQRTTVRALTQSELESESERVNRAAFDAQIEVKLGPNAKPSDFTDDGDSDTPDFETYSDDSDGTEQTMPEADEYDVDTFDQYIGAETLLSSGDSMLQGIVKTRKRDADGNPIGKANSNPLLDTRLYEVEFPDGDIREYAANVIAESIYSRVDDEGRHHLLLEAVVDHIKDDTAVPIDDGYIVSKGNRRRKLTTKGWKLCVKWKDGSTSWEALKDLKESNPVEVAEYAVSAKLVSEPAFAWWVPFTLKRRDRIIGKIDARFLKKTHKFGIAVPNTVKEALQMDKENGTSLWWNAIQKEMKNVRVAFNILDDDMNLPPAHTFVKCHIVFDVKMDLTRKARYVAGGHMTKPPSSMTYASVVSRESVRIILTLAALNGLEVLSSDIQNAYLTAPTKEKIWTTCGPEFGGEDSGKRAIVVRALYGLRSSGAAFRNHLAKLMTDLDFASCRADPDVWMRRATKPDGSHYYEYVLFYVDDALAVSLDPKSILLKIDKYFPMKPDSIAVPDIYLGATLSKARLPNGTEAWAMSSSKYVNEAIKNVKLWLEKRERKLPARCSTPLPTSYRPELDISPELDADDANYFQSVIGVLRWAVELGRVDITTEVSMLSSHLALPRAGHLVGAFHIFGYLEKKHNARMVFDPTYPTVDADTILTHDWTDFYGNVQEAVPTNAPDPLGKEVTMRCFVDADHAGDKLSRRSRTGFIIFVNGAPIIWFSKRQATIETSTFGSEFVAAKVATETIRGLRYKLRMLGVPIDGPAYFFGDNMSVITNISIPDSVLKKKSNSIAYHCVREAVAMGEILPAYVNTKSNTSDILTKVLPNGELRDKIVRSVLWDI